MSSEMTVRPRWSDEELGLTANGTFRPRWTNELTGDVALEHAAFEAVRQGYGCGECLRYFGGLYFERCPTCDARTGSYSIVPQWWTDASVV